MKISDRILLAEEQWFNEQLREAKFLILSVESYAELFSGDDYDIDHIYYEGLVVCVTHNPEVIDFELA